MQICGNFLRIKKGTTLIPCDAPQKVRLTGVEPAHLEPESSALSTELQTLLITENITSIYGDNGI